MPEILSTIDSPEDLRRLTIPQLEQLAAEARDEIVRVTTTAIGPRDLAGYAGVDPAPGTVPGTEFCGFADEVGAEE